MSEKLVIPDLCLAIADFRTLHDISSDCMKV